MIAPSSVLGRSTMSVPDINTSAAFVVDSHPSFGQVALIFQSRATEVSTLVNPSTGKLLSSKSTLFSGSTGSLPHELSEIWLQDTSGRWHYMCNTITQYLRLAIVHLGIHGWPLVFTPESLPPSTQQWLSVHCKERLVLDLYWHDRQFSTSKRA